MSQAVSWEVSQSTIAVVIEAPTTSPKVPELELRTLLRPPLSIGQGIAGDSMVSSTRDQMEVIFSNTKINVRDLSGREDFSSSKIPEVLHKFADWYDTPIRSYGINFTVTLPMPEPGVWIKRVLIHSDIGDKTGLALIKGAATISLKADPKILNIQFQENQEDPGGSLAVNFNASEDTEKLPDIEALRVELKTHYLWLKDLIAKLG